MNISAKWIWINDDNGMEYNSHVIFKKDFRLDMLPQEAKIAVTADTKYRLKVNGQWCADGPARAYFDHYCYDVIDASSLLKTGLNRIECEVRFAGCGTFHQSPQRGGFLFQLDADGSPLLLSDDSWEAAFMPQWVTNTPKMSPQMSAWEFFDASAKQPIDWKGCYIIGNESEVPWKNLYPRETPMLTREETLLKKVVSCRAVNLEYDTYAVYPHRMMFPDTFSVNNQDIVPLVLAFKVHSPEKQIIFPKFINAVASANGITPDKDGGITLKKGENIIVCGMRVACGHDANTAITFDKESNLIVEKVFCNIFKDLCSLTKDIPLYTWANNEHLERLDKYEAEKEKALSISSFDKFLAAYPTAQELSPEYLTECGAAISIFHAQYPNKKIQVKDMQNIVYPDDREAVIYPSDGCDVELLCDLGTQSVGYWNIMLTAPEGTVVDLAGFEYITPDGIIQQPGERYLNSMRYVCKDGFNRFTSYLRRGGRYVSITLRNFKTPVKFRSFRMVESTYPTVFLGNFRSSDIRLDRIYDISARTLKLCMEDTFTDCPLYEQTYWVGDGRNEAIFAMNSCGAYDIVRHCIRLTAESMRHLPLIGCQVPSAWSCQIPSFGYMWAMSIEDYYLETADLDFVNEMYPFVEELMKRSLKLCENKFGLLETYDWNFLDWSNMDTQHPYMLYNSFIFAGGLRCAARLAEIIGLSERKDFFNSKAKQLAEKLDEFWNERRQAYSEAIDKDGNIVDTFSIHTSLLALLYDVATPGRAAAVRTNILGDRTDLLPAGSPFFTYYLHELFESLGAWEQSYSKVKKDYLKMLDFDATTVWETFAEANYDHTHTNTAFFPTRSNCHAWSSIPLALFPRLLLGIRRTTPGCNEFTISPYTADLEHASGTRVTPHGPVEVDWRLDKEHSKLFITCRHPEQVSCKFVSNASIDDYHVEYLDIII